MQSTVSTFALRVNLPLKAFHIVKVGISLEGKIIIPKKKIEKGKFQIVSFIKIGKPEFVFFLFFCFFF